MTSSVSSLGANAPLQITGLASGLDTNSIVSQLMSIASQPLTKLQNEQTSVHTLNSNLTSMQTALQGLTTKARALSSATLFANTQSVTSTNSALVAASATSGVGAVVGGYQVGVSAMASAAQQTFGFSAPAALTTVTITPSTSGTDGTASTYKLQANATAQDLVNAVNADTKGPVWATVVNGSIVLSDRTTGSKSAFTATDDGHVLATGASQTPGADAAYSINNGATQYSQSNTVTGAIPGVTLTLGGHTGSSPVNVNVGAPAVSSAAIEQAVQDFVTTYNSVIDQVTTQLTQKPSSTDPTQGRLFNDLDLSSLLRNMRQTMYTAGQGLPDGMASMLDLGLGTGTASGAATPSQSAINGHLSVNTDTLMKTIQANPGGVTAVLKSWSQGFTTLVSGVSDTGGTIDSRIQGDNRRVSDLTNQISLMQNSLKDRQAQLTRQYAALEAALSQSQSTSSWLTSQINSLVVPGH